MHVHELLDELTVDEFEERYAAWEMGGEGDRLQHVSWIVTTICNQVTRYISTKSSDPFPDKAYMEPDALVPKYMRQRKPKKRVIKPNDPQAAELLAKHLGAL